MTLPGLVRANNLNDVVDRERAWDNLGSSLATGDIAIPAPSLNLNFAANKSLVDDISGNNLITFTRASTGTFVGSNGLIQTAASGVPRFDHNPTTGESLGLLVEEQRTNLLLYSACDSNWPTAGFGTPTYNLDLSALGVFSGVQVASLGQNWHSIYRAGISLTASTVYAFTLFYRAGTSGRVRLTLRNNTTLTETIVNGVAGNLSVSAAFAGAATILSQYLCSDGLTYVVTGTFTPNGTSADHWYRIGPDSTTSGQTVIALGGQLEAGAFPTSYIPTTGAAATRAADAASISGSNFSSWYRQDEGTMFADSQRLSSPTASEFPQVFFVSDGTGDNTINLGYVTSSVSQFRIRRLASNEANMTPNASTLRRITAGAYAANSAAMSEAGAAALVDTSVVLPSTLTQLNIGTNDGTVSAVNGTIRRLTYWPTRLGNEVLQRITQPSITAINLYAFNYAINGKDVLALNAVRNASTRNFIFIKGLLSAAQPRLTTAAASTSSALTLATNALPKLSPTSSGNYFFASGITLSGVTTRINGTNALSIATSPFSGSTATAPLLFRELRPQANWRFTEPMPSGTIASPEFAIPFETNDFVLFMKAGPN
jgi:hypothetical protein